MRMLTVTLLCCIASASGFAQQAETPDTLAGFLEPGTHIGVRSFDESDAIKITIYSKSDFEIAIDARRLELAALAAKYEKVAQARDRILEDFTASLDSKRSTLSSGKEYGEPKASLLVDRREGLYTVAHVGDDYVLVGYGNEETKRRVFATRFISTIGWYDGLRFHTSVQHVTKTADRTK